MNLVSVLKSCSNAASLTQGKLIHADIIRNGFESDMYVGITLVDLYAKCGNLEDAHRLFDSLPKESVVTWNVMITGYAQGAHGLKAQILFEQMQQEQVKPDNVTFLSLLKACSGVGALDWGKQIHGHIIGSGLKSDVSLGNSLIDMYAKCGSLEDAQRVFEKLPKRTVVTWNAMITGYAQCGQPLESLQLFQQLQLEGERPDNVTFVSILKACSGMISLDHGKLIHGHIVESDVQVDLILGNSLIEMYSKCQSLEDAGKIFFKLLKRDVVTWNVIVSGYVQNGHGEKALELFQDMQLEGIEPDNVTFACILKACSTITSLDQGKIVHVYICNCNLGSDVLIGNTLVDMYAKCGDLEEARRVFDKLPMRDVVTWNAMISGYAQNGLGSQEAIELFKKMQEIVQPNTVTYISILKGCSSMAALDQGKLIHGHITESGLQSNTLIGSTLISFYAECGSLEDASGVFDRLLKRDTVVWSAMIAGYCLHESYKLALQYFNDMQEDGLKPDDVAFVCLLSACSQMGLSKEAWYFFRSMEQKYGFKPTLEHYNCMVDLLSRAGHLNEAKEFLQNVPFQNNIVGWRSLLGNCKTYGNVELGRQCFNCIISMDLSNASAYVLMSNIYADAGMWESVVNMQHLREHAHAWKKPGQAFVEVDNKVHGFIVEDEGHPQCVKIYVKLDRLNMQMTEEGHVPQLGSVP